MRFSVGLGTMCALLLELSCARPSLDDDVEEDGGAAGQNDGKLPAGDDDDDDDDDDTAVKDAGRHDAGRDAGQDSGRRDAASEAGATMDTGASEEDAGDDVGEDEDAGCSGDSCPGPSSECDAEELSSELEVGGASVSAIRINGTQGTLANVSPGASVRVQLEVSFSNCGLLPTLRQVYVGLESATPTCQSALCSSLGSAQNLEFTLNAPSEQGLHYISIGIEEGGLLCAANGSADTHLAALCVAP